MGILNQIFETYTESTVMMATLAVIITILFKLLSNKIAYIVIRIFKMKIEDKKEIMDNGFYKPISTLITLLGLYIGILMLTKPLQINIQTMEFINKIFKIIATLLIAKGCADSLTTKSNLFKKIAEKAEYKTDDASIKLIINIIRGAIYIVAGFVVILEIGYDLSGLVTGLGIGSIVITLAAQDTAKSILGGLMIALDKPFKIGDWISIPSAEGEVEEITFRSTRIRNLNNCIVNVPNSTIMQSIITNSSKIETRRFEAKLLVKSDTPLEKVKILEETILSMMEQNEDVINHTLTVHFEKITGGGFEILINALTKTTDYVEYIVLKEELNYKIMNIINSQKITLV